jgi:thiosulfate dehydrogenase
MSSRFGSFVLGIIITIAVFFVGGYLYLTSGAISMATNAPPLPLERTVARLALRASFGDAAQMANPLTLDDTNMLAGATQFKGHCGGCHGLPGRPSGMAKRMFPEPPQLFEKDEMVTDDPEGITYWKVTHGIRLSGMPSFLDALSETERWQVTMLLAHADKLSSPVRAALTPASK